jgi:hypothetical protein
MGINFKIVAVATGPARRLEHGLAVGASRGAEAVFSEGADAALPESGGRSPRARKPFSEGKRARKRPFRGKNGPKSRFSEGKRPFPYCKFAPGVYCWSR